MSTAKCPNPKGASIRRLDAETNGQEGAYYVWQKDEVGKLLTPDEFIRAGQIYGLSDAPNFGNAYVLQMSQPLSKWGHQKNCAKRRSFKWLTRYARSY